MLEKIRENLYRVWQGETLIGEYDNPRSAGLAEDTVRQWQHKVSQGLNPPPLIAKPK